MSLRRNWNITLGFQKVLGAAVERREYHLRRVEWWLEEQAQTQTKLAEKGITVTTHQVTGGARHSLGGDPDLINRFAECQDKISEHRSLVREYTSWMGMLQQNTDSLTLDYDDYTFFFGTPFTSEEDGF